MFVIDVDLDDVAPAVVALLRERVDDFRAEPLALDPEIFAPLGLGIGSPTCSTPCASTATSTPTAC